MSICWTSGPLPCHWPRGLLPATRGLLGFSPDPGQEAFWASFLPLVGQESRCTALLWCRPGSNHPEAQTRSIQLQWWAWGDTVKRAFRADVCSQRSFTLSWGGALAGLEGVEGTLEVLKCSRTDFSFQFKRQYDLFYFLWTFRTLQLFLTLYLSKYKMFALDYVKFFINHAYVSFLNIRPVYFVKSSEPSIFV